MSDPDSPATFKAPPFFHHPWAPTFVGVAAVLGVALVVVSVLFYPLAVKEFGTVTVTDASFSVVYATNDTVSLGHPLVSGGNPVGDKASGPTGSLASVLVSVADTSGTSCTLLFASVASPFAIVSESGFVPVHGGNPHSFPVNVDRTYNSQTNNTFVFLNVTLPSTPGSYTLQATLIAYC